MIFQNSILEIMSQFFRNNRDLKTTERKDPFLQNGAAVLEQVIRNFNGNSNPIRSYSTEELNKATTDFSAEIHRDWDYVMYRGIHKDREIFVKKFKADHCYFYTRDDQLKAVSKDIAISSKMSSHANALKLLGCCLETELPILIFEFPEKGNLGTRLYSSDEELTWDEKLKVAIGISNAICYLHRGLPKTFIHGDVKPRNIFLDRNLSPKLSAFQLAIPVPEGETHADVELIVGTLGYLAPDAVRENRYTEKSDVYGFGALLCEVLTGKEIIELRRWHYQMVSGAAQSGSVDPNFHLDVFVRDAVEEHCRVYLEDERIRVQVMEFAKLVQRCLQENPDDRPDMTEAEKALRFIRNI